uniref:Uncharacterized protein n=1 Tax=Anguilla anguilla TaxID=7936 RepID=A0A0E9PIR6_ANGAN
MVFACGQTKYEKMRNLTVYNTVAYCQTKQTGLVEFIVSVV